MKKIRIGNDISITWSVRVSGKTHPLEGKQLVLYLTAPNSVRTELTDFSVSGNLLSLIFPGRDQHYEGVYSLSLVETYNNGRRLVLDCCNAFQLVDWSCMAEEDGYSQVVLDTDVAVSVLLPVIPTIGTNGHWFVDGEDTGKPAFLEAVSAYDIAVENGFSGTEEQWLDTIYSGFDEVSGKIWQDSVPEVKGAVGASGTGMKLDLQMFVPYSRTVRNFFDFYDLTTLDPPEEVFSSTAAKSNAVYYSGNVAVCFEQFQLKKMPDDQCAHITYGKDFSFRAMGARLRTVRFYSDDDDFPSADYTPSEGHIVSGAVWVGNAGAVVFANASEGTYDNIRRIEVESELSADEKMSVYDFTDSGSLSPGFTLPDLGESADLTGTYYPVRGQQPDTGAASLQITSASLQSASTGEVTVSTEAGFKIMAPSGRTIRMIALKGVSWTVSQDDISVNGQAGVFDDWWFWEGNAGTVAEITVADDATLIFTGVIVVLEKQ